MKNRYHIQFFAEQTRRWVTMVGFDYMQKGYAMGARAMLKAHYNHPTTYRLMDGEIVIEEMGKQTVKV